MKLQNKTVIVILLSVLFSYSCKKSNYKLSTGPFQAPVAKLAMEPKRCITIDRQYHSVPDPLHILPEELEQIRQMGFGCVKLVVNPAIHKMGDKAINMFHIEKMVNLVTSHGLPVLITIHPEADFKNRVFGNEAEYAQLLTWYQDFTGFLAQHWSPDTLAFQFMTEPFGDSPNPYAWNYWNKLQPGIWKAVRKAMPKHTLILSGSSVGRIEGVTQVEPVDDENVMYAFSHYEPFLFTLQGAYWPGFEGTYFNYVRHVPYPGSPAIIEAALPDILQEVPAAIQPEATAALRIYGAETWNREKLAARMQMMVDWNTLHGGGMKLFAGEFGVLAKTVAPADRYRFIKDFRQVFEEKGIGWSYWSYNETFTVLSNGQPDPMMLDALLDH